MPGCQDAQCAQHNAQYYLICMCLGYFWNCNQQSSEPGCQDTQCAQHNAQYEQHFSYFSNAQLFSFWEQHLLSIVIRLLICIYLWVHLISVCILDICMIMIFVCVLGISGTANNSVSHEWATSVGTWVEWDGVSLWHILYGMVHYGMFRMVHNVWYSVMKYEWDCGLGIIMLYFVWCGMV